MTPTETGTIMDILKTAYPGFYNRPGAPNMKQTINLWAEMFRDDDVSIVAAAVKSYIAEDVSGYPPHIGAIKNAMYSLAKIGEMDEQEAWEILRKAVSKSGWSSKEEYDKLPEEIKSMTSPGQLYEWSQMDSDIFNSVVSSNFRRVWRVRQDKRKHSALLPKDVKRVISGLSERMKLESKNL